MNDRVLGVDEAGRGPIVGPMVMAAVALSPRSATALRRAGVADSKSYSGPGAQAERASLVPRILALADYATLRVIDVERIDEACAVKGLNRLEQAVATEMIERGPPSHRIVCDGARLFAPLEARFSGLEARDGGESVHVAVAAASVLAKVRRDELFSATWRRYARCCELPETPSGGGYLNEATRRFLRRVIAELGCIPPEGRLSWPWDFALDLLPAAPSRPGDPRDRPSAPTGSR